MKNKEYFFDDFTEENYKSLLILAKERFVFKFFDLADCETQHILLRHDIDHSIERALSLANIESEVGVASTFFVYLHSEMYSVFEKESLNQLKEIINSGARIGLHFDPAFYEIHTQKDLMRFIDFEKKVLERLLGIEISNISFHSPNFDFPLINLKQNEYCGMLNTYSPLFQEKYEYISDSNGYWRFKRLEDLILSSSENLHVLLHPVWWTESSMSPRDRVQQCVNKRATRSAEIYDSFTHASNRMNITSAGESPP